MRIAPCGVSILLLTGLVPTQVQLRVFAHTDLTVVNQTIRAGTDITGGATLGWRNNHPTLPASATRSASWPATSSS